MSDEKLEVWGQDSDIKGPRLIRFRRNADNSLTWLGPVGEPDVTTGQFRYSEMELGLHGWERVE